MLVLIDSDVLIEVLRGHDEAIVEKWLGLAASSDTTLCSPVSIAELWQSARPREEASLTALFDVMLSVPADAQIGRLAGDCVRRYSKSHRVELADALIGATAIFHGAHLWSRNRKRYPMPEIRFY
jgi:predicted nucleic acid-binding protein